MIRRSCPAAFALVVGLMLSAPALPQWDLQKLQLEYQAVSEQIQKHLVHDRWIDDDPGSPGLLERQWSLAGDWLAAWLDAHPSAEVEDIQAARGPADRCDGGAGVSGDGDDGDQERPGTIYERAKASNGPMSCLSAAWRAAT